MSLAIFSCLEHDQASTRPGGDEFLVLASNTSTKRAGSNGINQFSTRLRLPFRIGLIRFIPAVQ
ncbi:hypothetical protein ACNKHP_01315 [Shigella boydii]